MFNSVKLCVVLVGREPFSHSLCSNRDLDCQVGCV